jgi:hypothetical protein
MTMKAGIGDRIVIQSRHLDEPARDGEIVEVHGPDGGPPYLVRWAEDGHTALLYPGPDAHVSGPARTASQPLHQVKAWHATVLLTEEEGRTLADATLSIGDHVLRGRGVAHRNPADPNVPEIGDELAAARALVALGNRLVQTTADDIGAVEGHEVRLRR